MAEDHNKKTKIHLLLHYEDSNFGVVGVDELYECEEILNVGCHKDQKVTWIDGNEMYWPATVVDFGGNRPRLVQNCELLISMENKKVLPSCSNGKQNKRIRFMSQKLAENNETTDSEEDKDHLKRKDTREEKKRVNAKKKEVKSKVNKDREKQKVVLLERLKEKCEARKLVALGGLKEKSSSSKSRDLKSTDDLTCEALVVDSNETFPSTPSDHGTVNVKLAAGSTEARDTTNVCINDVLKKQCKQSFIKICSNPSPAEKDHKIAVLQLKIQQLEATLKITQTERDFAFQLRDEATKSANAVSTVKVQPSFIPLFMKIYNNCCTLMACMNEGKQSLNLQNEVNQEVADDVVVDVKKMDDLVEDVQTYDIVFTSEIDSAIDPTPSLPATNPAPLPLLFSDQDKVTSGLNLHLVDRDQLLHKEPGDGLSEVMEGSMVFMPTITKERIISRSTSASVVIRRSLPAVFTQSALRECTCDGSLKGTGKERPSLHSGAKKAIFDLASFTCKSKGLEVRNEIDMKKCVNNFLSATRGNVVDKK